MGHEYSESLFDRFFDWECRWIGVMGVRHRANHLARSSSICLLSADPRYNLRDSDYLALANSNEFTVIKQGIRGDRTECRARLHTDALPFRPSGRASLLSSALGRDPLLLVVHCGALDLVAFCISSARGDRAALAVSCQDNPAADGDFTAFLDVESVRTIVDLRYRSRVLIRIALDGIVFSVEFASPLVMRRLAVLVGAVDRDLHVFTRRLVNDGTILGRPRAYFRLGLVELPGAHHVSIGGEAHGCPDEA